MALMLTVGQMEKVLKIKDLTPLTPKLTPNGTTGTKEMSYPLRK